MVRMRGGCCMKMYESDNDRRNQRSAMEKVEKLFNWTLDELPERYVADWAAFKKWNSINLLDGIVEYKRRNNNHDAHDSVFLDAKKYVSCKQLSDAFAVPFYYIQEWDDKIGICQPNIKDAIRSKVAVKRSLRRDDTDDTYLFIHLPLERFDLYKR